MTDAIAQVLATAPTTDTGSVREDLRRLGRADPTPERAVDVLLAGLAR